MSRRKCTQIVRGQHAIDGAGVHLRRVLGLNTIKDFDPFLMLDVLILPTLKITSGDSRGIHTVELKQLPTCYKEKLNMVTAWGIGDLSGISNVSG